MAAPTRPHRGDRSTCSTRWVSACTATWGEWLAYARDGHTPQQYDAWAEQQARHAENAELDRLPADLDGRAVMAVLGVTGPAVCAALRHLRRLRRDHGPLGREQAEAALRAWAREQRLR